MGSMAELVVDLKLDRSLIDSQFDGYKLSLDSLPIYKTTLEKGPDVVKLTEEQHSYQHLRAFGLTNHIISDPWDQNSAYIVTESWDVVKVSISLESSPEVTVSVFTIPEANETRQKVGRHNVSVNFVSEELAVLADGAGTLFIIDTGIRTENKEPWTIKHQCVPLDNKKPFVLTYSAVKPSNVSPCIECVALHVEETADERKGNSAPFETLLEWLSFAQDDKKEWRLSRTRSLVCARCPEYVSIDVKSDALLLTSQKPARLIYDSLKPVTPPTEGATESKEDSGPEYTWSQTAEDVTVLFTVPSSVGKADIYMSLHPAQIEFGVKNSRVLLQGALQGQVDIDGSTWTIENERITLTLCKADEMTWQTVVRGDSRGEMVDSPEQIDAIHSRLADITSEEWNPDPKLTENRPYNSQELEECDAFAEDSAVLQRIDGDTHSVTHQANISSHQWLFNVQTRPDTLPAVCLRHDVDGVVWQPLTPSGATEGQGSIFKHHATFNAFGYVQASKQQRRFCAAPPDMSYVVIADCVRHVYIYRQPSPILSPIRNRKTGRQVNAIAKQQLVSLEAVTDILGIHATNDRLYLLAGNIFHVVKVN